MSTELRYNEIRQELKGLDQLLVLSKLKEAVEANDIELLLAVQSAPRVVRDKLVDPDAFQTEVIEKWLQKHRGRSFSKLKTSTEALQIFDSNQKTAQIAVQHATMTTAPSEEAIA